jgi:hypothetical protein
VQYPSLIGKNREKREKVQKKREPPLYIHHASLARPKYMHPPPHIVFGEDCLQTLLLIVNKLLSRSLSLCVNVKRDLV